jgi:hypothetical protein
LKNKLFEQFGTAQKVNQPEIQNGPFKSMNDFMDRFNRFAQTVTGNPEDQIQQLLDSGQMTQQQYNVLYGLAKKIMSCS